MLIGIVTCLSAQKGLAKDGVILAARIREAGHEAALIDYVAQEPYPPMTFDALLFCEVLEPRFYQMLKPGGKKLRIPNPEWEMPIKIADSTEMDAVWCKTEDALSFGVWPRAKLIGFESDDLAPAEFADPVQFLHPSGSMTRGTASVLEAWGLALGRGMPSSSTLTVTQPPAELDAVTERLKVTPRVIQLGRQPEEDFRALQRRCFVHVIASEYEGWCHLFWEALSIGAHVIATDGPWWSAARGAYAGVPGQYLRHRGIAPALAIDIDALASAMVVASLMRPTPNHRCRLLYLGARADFRERFARELEAVLG